jgi:type II secretory pathway pseudopilin PulG
MTTRNSSSGFSLVETLIGMSLLGTVLLGVLTLFYFGRGNVFSGKQMTNAVALGTRVTEDLSTMSGDDIYAMFNIGTGSSLGSYTINGVTYTNALIRSTSPTIVTAAPADIQAQTDPDGAGPALGYLTNWNNQITDFRSFTQGSVTLIIMPRQPTQIMTGGSPNLPAPGMLHVRTIVRWREGARPRVVYFDTVKTRRGF